MSRNSKLIKNSFIYFIGNFASKILNIVLIPIYIVYLDTTDFGMVNLLLLLSGIIGIFFSMDIIDAAYRFILEDRDNKHEKIITNSLAVFGIGMVLFLIFYIPIVINMKLKYGILLGLHIILTNFVTLMQHFIRGMRFNKLYAVAGIIICLVQGISNIFMIVIMGMGSISILIAPLIASVITGIFINSKIHIEKYINFKMLDRKLIKELLAYGGPISIGILFYWVIMNSGTYFLQYFSGDTMQSGIYAMVNKFPVLFNALASIFKLAWQETAVEEYSSNDATHYYNYIFDNFVQLNILIAALMLPIISLYFALFETNNYLLSKQYIPILFLANIFGNISGWLMTGYYVIKSTNSLFLNYMLGGLVTLGLNVLLIPRIGIHGVTIGVLGGYLALMFATYKGVSKFIHYKPDIIRYVIMLILFAIVSVIYYSVNIYMQIGCFIVLLLLIIFFQRKVLIQIVNQIKIKKKSKGYDNSI